MLAGRYQIGQRLGSGGMGDVYDALQLDLGRRVAIKVLRKRTDATALGRFEREARAAAALGHPHIVMVTDFGQPPDGPPFLVMERLVGLSLGEALRRYGPVPPERAAGIGVQMLAALDAAHERGIVHRDIKPDNVFLCEVATGGDFVKLLDFGIAKLTDDGAEGPKTVAGALVGTIAYMAPEQAAGGAIDARTDVYAVAACLYRAMTGRHAVEVTGNRAADLYAIAHQPPVPIELLSRDIDPRFAAAIRRGLEKDPEDRFQSAREMADTIRASLGEVPAAAPIPNHVRAQPTSDPSESTAGSDRDASHRTMSTLGAVPHVMVDASAPIAAPHAGGEPKPTPSAAPPAGGPPRPGRGATALMPMVSAPEAPRAPEPPLTGAPSVETTMVSGGEPSPRAPSANALAGMPYHAPSSGMTPQPVHAPRAESPSRMPIVLAGLGAIVLLGVIAAVAIVSVLQRSDADADARMTRKKSRGGSGGAERVEGDPGGPSTIPSLVATTDPLSEHGLTMPRSFDAGMFDDIYPEKPRTDPRTPRGEPSARPSAAPTATASAPPGRPRFKLHASMFRVHEYFELAKVERVVGAMLPALTRCYDKHYPDNRELEKVLVRFDGKTGELEAVDSTMHIGRKYIDYGDLTLCVYGTVQRAHWGRAKVDGSSRFVSVEFVLRAERH